MRARVCERLDRMSVGFLDSSTATFGGIFAGPSERLCGFPYASNLQGHTCSFLLQAADEVRRHSRFIYMISTDPIDRLVSPLRLPSSCGCGVLLRDLLPELSPVVGQNLEVILGLSGWPTGNTT